jgi:hypothetical protein
MDAQFLDKQFAELGLSQEQVERMTLSEAVKHATKLHGEPPKVVGTVSSPVSSNYHLMTNQIGQFDTPMTNG